MTAPDTAALALLRKLSLKASDGEWFFEHGATDDGLSRIDDGRGEGSGMFPIYGEAHEVELIVAAVNYVRTQLAASDVALKAIRAAIPRPVEQEGE